MLVRKDYKKLILNLREPERVLEAIPHAKTLVHDKGALVIIPHRDDEVRVLKNLGFDAPAPIDTYYAWPCGYPSGPMQHQRITAQFMTLNPRAYCLNGMGCIEGDARVRVSRKGKSYETDLRTLAEKFHALPDRDSWRVRSLKGETFGMNRLLDVLVRGAKPTLRIQLQDGKVFRCTADHRIARPDGAWTAAGDLRVGDALVTNGDILVACPRCGVSRARKSPPRYAGQQCRACKHAAHRGRMAGERNPAWKGGTFIDPDGYVRQLCRGHHRADHKGYVYQHILIAEQAFGVAVTREMHVHHKSGDKTDNRPENLEVLSPEEHHRGHAPYAKLDGAVSGKGGVLVVVPKSSGIVKIEDGGEVDVYDLCMEGPHHNFVVNGVVVHNSGKTLSALWAFDWLRETGRARRMLVVAPLSTLTRTWYDEVFTHLSHLSCAVLHGDQERRLKLLAIPHDVYVINHDGVKSKPILDALCAREDIDVLCIDELAVARTAGTERFKAFNRLAKDRPYVWGMTGTPTPNAPTDAWAQCRLITPGSVPKFFGQFRDATMRQLNQFKYVAKPDALETVHRAMQPAIRFSREECIDLPPTTHQTREVPLTKEQTKLFNDMVRTLKAEHEGGQVLAVNEAVKLGKLIQICCGLAYGLDEAVDIPCGPRFDVVDEIIDEAEGKVIVFVPYTKALLKLAAHLRKTTAVECVYGEVSKNERDRIFRDFQRAANPRVLVADARTMSHGLSLTAANTIVWFAPTTSTETYMQANERIPRPGQKLSTHVIHIESTPVERAMYERLRHRKSMNGALLDLIKGGA